MRKLTLDLTDLEVTSFETQRNAGHRGTVQGHKPPTPTYMDATCNDYTCNAMDYSCDHATCGSNCYETAAAGPCFSWPYTGCEDCAYQTDITCGC